MRRTLATMALALAFQTGEAMGAPMIFEVVEQAAVGGAASKGISAAIYARGDISSDASKRFDEIVDARMITNAIVYFDSTGGQVVEAIRMGQSIRKRGFSTGVQRRGDARDAMCASACVYAYVGGIARYLNDDRGRLGVHQYYSPTNVGGEIRDSKDDLKIAQLLGSIIVAHLQQMGVSSALYVAAAMTDSSEMLWLKSRRAMEYDLVNNGFLPTTAEIMLTDDGEPYLQIRQIADKGETRITLSCDKGEANVIAGAVGEGDSLRFIRSQATGSSIEMDGEAFLPEGGVGGIVDMKDGGVEVERTFPLEDVPHFTAAKTIGFAIDAIGGRWTREVDVTNVKERIAYFTRTCVNREERGRSRDRRSAKR